MHFKIQNRFMVHVLELFSGNNHDTIGWIAGISWYLTSKHWWLSKKSALVPVVIKMGMSKKSVTMSLSLIVKVYYGST